MENILSHFNYVDYAFITILAVWLVKGFVRGLSRELTGLIIIVLAYVLSLRFYGPLSEKLMQITRLEDTPARITGYILSFLVLAIVLKLLSVLLHQVMEWTFGGFTERMGGLVASGMKAVVAISIIILLVGLSSHDYLRRHIIDESAFGQVGNRHLPALYYQIASRLPFLPQIENPDPEAPANDDERREEPESDPEYGLETEV